MIAKILKMKFNQDLFKIKDEETDDLTDESYKKIFKSYKRELRTLR